MTSSVLFSCNRFSCNRFSCNRFSSLCRGYSVNVIFLGCDFVYLTLFGWVLNNKEVMGEEKNNGALVEPLVKSLA